MSCEFESIIISEHIVHSVSVVQQRALLVFNSQGRVSSPRILGHSLQSDVYAKQHVYLTSYVTSNQIYPSDAADRDPLLRPYILHCTSTASDGLHGNLI